MQPPGVGLLYRASALKFDIQSQIAGRTITKATLRLYVYSLRGEFSITPQIIMSAIATDWNPNTLTYHIYETMLIYNDGQVVEDAPVAAACPLISMSPTSSSNGHRGTAPTTDSCEPLHSTKIPGMHPTRPPYSRALSITTMRTSGRSCS